MLCLVLEMDVEKVFYYLDGIFIKQKNYVFNSNKLYR